MAELTHDLQTTRAVVLQRYADAFGIRGELA
jgi:hypothetical protein